MSGGSSGGGGQDPSYQYNIERDRQQIAINEARDRASEQAQLARNQMQLERDQMEQQRVLADRVAAQQAEQQRAVEAETARVAAEKAAQDAENAKVAAATEQRRKNRTIGGVQSFATNGYGGFGGAGRTLGTTAQLG